MWRFILIFSLCAATLLGDPSPYSVASLVHQSDERLLSDALETALESSEPLVRATAARVIAVRGLHQFLPRLREKLLTEGDAVTAREQIRALTLLGNDDDVVMALKAAARWPSDMDDALALAVARRGSGADVLKIYLSTLRESRMRNASEFFRVALWGRADLIAITGSRLVGAGDERGWRGVLRALTDSNVAMNGGVMASSLSSPSEDIRTASLWYLVKGYAPQPQSMDALVKQKLAEPRTEMSSDRVDFAYELLRRMLGGEKVDDPRWLRFLESTDADDLLIGESAVHPYLTDAEYAVRYNRCEVQTRECVMPSKPSTTKMIPSQPVTPPAFNLPEVLPPGLAEAILAGARCNDDWLGLATAAVDRAGRVKTLDLSAVQTNARCKQAIDTVLRLSMATNGSLQSAFTGPILLVHAARTSLCLDEDPPQSGGTSTVRVGGAVQAPKVSKRVEPNFPESARRTMKGGHNVLVIVESVISKAGCVRSIRLLSQSPYPELNGAAVMALSKWKFSPGYLDGKPVDVQFALTINFIVR